MLIRHFASAVSPSNHTRNHGSRGNSTYIYIYIYKSSFVGDTSWDELCVQNMSCANLNGANVALNHCANLRIQGACKVLRFRVSGLGFRV